MDPFELPHPIFCNERILEVVQMAGLYEDSKTFVDKKLKHNPKRVLEKFDHMIKIHGHGREPLSRQVIQEFVDHNFDEEGLELEAWTPDDWTPSPRFFDKLHNPKLLKLARRLNNLWLDLSRKISDEVQANPSLYSIIYVPHGFVVPGGRFREFYYWDTYWIVKALLHCDMTKTVKGIIENFFIMVDVYGLVPNGGRIYYIKRSQPPFLVLMMTEYINKTGDIDYLKQRLETMAKEISFWEEKRRVGVHVAGKSFDLFTYGTDDMGPRPESFREDVELAKILVSSKERENLYKHMKAGAETGWDYSTRWMIDGKMRNRGGLRATKAGHIVPVDLNSLMFMNYRNMADFCSILGKDQSAAAYRKKAYDLKDAIYHVLWAPEDNMWYDYDTFNHILRKHFYPSNLFPLWAECYDACDRSMVAECATNYLKKTAAIYCNGGVPTSLVESGQQWDFPNAWPPLQHIIVSGLLKTENHEARRVALTIARRYTVGTMFSSPDGAEWVLYEKYHAREAGVAGGGGEYEVQTGFGWTNGVVIEFMHLFGDELLLDDGIDEEYQKEGLIDLVTQFDMSQNKSLLIRRSSTVALSLQHLVDLENQVAEEESEEDADQDAQRENCFDVDSDEEDQGLILKVIRRMSRESAMMPDIDLMKKLQRQYSRALSIEQKQSTIDEDE